MSIAEQVSRIRGEKSRLGIKLSNMGLASQTDKLEKMVDAVEGIVDIGAVDATVLQGESYTIPAGYHNGSGTVRGLDNPVEDASKYLLQSKKVTPTKAQQSVTSDQGYYGLSSVTVERIPDAFQDVSQVTATEADVLFPKTIVKPDGSLVTGAIQDRGAKVLFLGLADDKGNWISRQAIPKGYHDGNGYALIYTDEKEVTPDKTTKTITPDVGMVLKQVTVNPIPDNYIDLTDASIAKGEDDLTVDGHKVNVPAGYYPQAVSKGVKRMSVLEEFIDVLDEPVDTDPEGLPVLLATEVNAYVDMLYIGIDPSLENALSEI